MERLRVLAWLTAISLCAVGCSKELGNKMPDDLPPNDNVGALIAQISAGDANTVLAAVEKLPKEIEHHSGRESLGYIIPKIEPLLKHENDSIRYWAAMSLGKLGPMAGDTVPQLISALTDKMDDYSSKSSASGVQYALGRISPNWIDRNDVPNDVRERFSKH